jgi:hypothetical protein
MRNRILAALPILPLLTALVYAQSGARYVVLPGREARQLSDLCSRPGPKVNDAWQPSSADIDVLEKRLFLIAKLVSTSGLVGIHIAHPERYHRQYVGIRINGRNVIYVNAFVTEPGAAGDAEVLKQAGSGFEGLSGLPAAWHEHLVNPCDGGSMFWGVDYDPKTHQFLDLSINLALPAPPPPPPK